MSGIKSTIFLPVVAIVFHAPDLFADESDTASTSGADGFFALPVELEVDSGNPDPVPGEKVFGLGDLTHANFFTPPSSGKVTWVAANGQPDPHFVSSTDPVRGISVCSAARSGRSPVAAIAGISVS
jgi:hypothetical protein